MLSALPEGKWMKKGILISLFVKWTLHGVRFETFVALLF
jgi:hypothetical protein